MKQRRNLILPLTLSVLLGLSGWLSFTSRAASGHTGAGQQVGEPFRVPAIAAGYYHNLALKSDGTVMGWGRNDQGQTDIPPGLSGVVALAASYAHSLALKSNGIVVSWGNNSDGQTDIPEGLSSVTAIGAGIGHSLALKSDGTVVAWGANDYGQTDIPAGLSGVTAIAAGGLHSLALKSDGTVVGWGDNADGKTDIPAGLSGVVAIAAGDGYSLAIKSDGTVVGWGLSNFTIPAGLSGVVAIAVGLDHNLALKSDGTVVAWGDNGYGQTTIPAGLSGVVAIAAGNFHSLALKSDGTVVAWGDNRNEQTNIPLELTVGSSKVVAWGNNFYEQTTIPPGLSSVTAIAAGFYHSLALKSDGTVVAWGRNDQGQATIPPGLSGVVAIAAGGGHNLALKSDGTVVAWGNNDQGQATIPPGLSSVVAIAAGGFHSLALKSDGTVVAWGHNTAGQATIPPGLSGVTAIAAGYVHSLALKSDGTVVGWGNNASGQATIPPGLSSVVAIAAGFSHSLALKSDGTVVGWGDNADGQLNIPAGLSGVTAIAAGDYHSLALSFGNAPPTLTPSSITRTAGVGSSNSQIATAAAQDAVNTLVLQISSDGGLTFGNTATRNGVTVTLTDSNAGATGANPDDIGKVFADVVATCTATNATFKLKVTDSGGLTDTKDLTVTVNANQLPTLTYPSNPGTSYGTALTVSPITGPSDDVAVTGIAVQSIAPSNPGGIIVNGSGVVSVASTVPANNYTVTIRISDVCGAKDVSFPLGIAKAPLTVTVNNAFRNQGAANPPFSGSVTGHKNGDVITASYSTTATTASAPGNYPITATLNDPGNRLGNYQVTNPGGTLKVFNSCGISVVPFFATQGAVGGYWLYYQPLIAFPLGNYTFSLFAGTLPPGLAIVNNFGQYTLQGTPTTRGTYRFTLLAKRTSSTCEAIHTYTITIL